MHSLSKNLFQQSIFVVDLEQFPFFLRSYLNINNFAVLYHFLKTLLNNKVFLAFTERINYHCCCQYMYDLDTTSSNVTLHHISSFCFDSIGFCSFYLFIFRIASQAVLFSLLCLSIIAYLFKDKHCYFGAIVPSCDV